MTKKKIIWLVVSCVMVLSLVLASCAPSALPAEEKPSPPAEEKQTSPKEERPAVEKPATPPATEKEMTTDSLGRLVEKPRYGGIFIQGSPIEPQSFDDGLGHVYFAWTLQLTNEDLFHVDWSKGPTGTGQTTLLYIIFPTQDVQVGALAESWELADPETLVFHIRKGVSWHNKPPVNGRELVADDVVFSLTRCLTLPTAYTAGAYPWKTHVESITAPDKWTVVIKCLPGKTGMMFETCGEHIKILPPEMIEKYGSMKDWRNSCGTGAYILVDFVPGSSCTFVRNPNYWGKDPLHPENQIPYLDGVKHLTIPDTSTRYAALRTAKVDWLGGYNGSIGWEDAEQLIRTSPQLKYVKYIPSATSILYWRLDTPPFTDKRVRRALCMSIDREEMISTIYGGEAEILTWPVLNVPELADMYWSLDKLPESTREIYEYHPDKAKQLLAEAGYPNGFQTSVMCTTSHVDLLSIVKAYWEKIGVDLKLDVKEYAVYASQGQSRTYDQMYMYGANNTIPFRFAVTRPGSLLNKSFVDDPVINEAEAAVNAVYFDPLERRRLMRDVIPHMLDQAYDLQFPVANVYTFWWPWVKNYNGEALVGYMNADDFSKYIWLDQDLKEEMTGRK